MNSYITCKKFDRTKLCKWKTNTTKIPVQYIKQVTHEK